MATARLRTSLVIIFVLVAVVAFAAPATMRLDYYHTGNSFQEMFSVDAVVIEPLPWPGNPQKPMDTTNRGKYYFEVRDVASNRLLYSRGFSSIYGEWETTDEAKKANRTFHESLRFPTPDAPVEIVVKKRDSQNQFREIWTTVVDPKDKYVDTSRPAPPGKVIEIEKNGDPAMKVDLLFLGEGYSATQQDKCEKDVRRIAEGVFTFSPFKERRKDFNLWGICSPAAEAGISRPSAGIHRHTLYGSTFDVFGTDRYALSFDNKAIRTAASFAPYDVLAIVMNESAYGNGGIFGQYASVSADYPRAVQVFVHEFGHHFADLGDEYYFNANVAYGAMARRVEPWEPNITALLDPKNLKWKELVSPDTPIPTPWEKELYENTARETPQKIREMRAAGKSNDEIAAAMRAAREAQRRAFDSGPYKDKVGAFEGAMYETKGLYRPQLKCLMINGDTFCAVCRHAIAEIIDLYSRP